MKVRQASVMRRRRQSPIELTPLAAKMKPLTDEVIQAIEDGDIKTNNHTDSLRLQRERERDYSGNSTATHQPLTCWWSRQAVGQQHNNNTPATYVLEVRRAVAQLLLVLDVRRFTGLDYLSSSRTPTRAFKCRGWRAPSR